VSETRIGLTHDTPQASSLLLVGTLALVWGCNWPVMKLGVTEIAPLTFRASTIAFAGIGLLLASRLSGESLRIPRRMWSKVIIMGLFNIGGWNALILFGVQQLPAGRSAILAFTMPVWAVLLSKALLHEPLSRRKLIGMLFGMAGMALLLGEDIRHVQRAPAGALLILAAAASWAFGTVLLRRWKLALPQNTLTGWMMVIGWVPIVLVAPLPRSRQCRAWVGSRFSTTSFSLGPSRIGRGSGWLARFPLQCPRCHRCQCRWSACCRGW